MVYICEEVIAGIEEGFPCLQEGCRGVMELAPSKNCSCHINPPCASCVNAGYICGACGWETEPDDYEIDDYSPPARPEAGSRRDQHTSTHTSDPFNSTPFTSCCGVAAIGNERCPNCEALILFHDDGLSSRRREVGPGNCLMCGQKRSDIGILGNCNC
jgi:hypothetical protein